MSTTPDPRNPMSEEELMTPLEEEIEAYQQDIDDFLLMMIAKYPAASTLIAGVYFHPAETPEEEEDPDREADFTLTIASESGPVENALALGAAMSSVFADAYALDRAADDLFDQACFSAATGVAVYSDDDAQAAVSGIALQIIAESLGLPPLPETDTLEDEADLGSMPAENAAEPAP